MTRSPTVARGTELRRVGHDRWRREGASDSPFEFSEVHPASFSSPVRKTAVLRAHPESGGEKSVTQPHGGRWGAIPLRQPSPHPRSGYSPNSPPEAAARESGQ